MNEARAGKQKKPADNCRLNCLWIEKLSTLANGFREREAIIRGEIDTAAAATMIGAALLLMTCWIIVGESLKRAAGIVVGKLTIFAFNLMECY